MLKTSPDFTDDPTLWRYVDLAKLIDMLETNQLFFNRLDKFEDPYEGVMSPAKVNYVRSYSTIDTAVFNRFMMQSNSDTQRNIYANCWFKSEYESAAMWELYLASSEGVAVKTSFNNLRTVLDGATCNGAAYASVAIHLTQVEYIDYEKEFTADGWDSITTHKRLSFAHEQELRAVMLNHENAAALRLSDPFARVDVSMQQLIQAIHICPTAAPWFTDLIKKIMARYQYTCPIVKSNLYQSPKY